jgi:predicted anti-sigma-YlaC factor YlaD
MTPPSQLCERARNWASLLADNELSELEHALLDAHLARCAACSVFAQTTESATIALRSAPLVEPVRRVKVPLVREHRRTAVRALKFVAASALVLAAGALAATTGASGNGTKAKPVAMVAGIDSPDGLRELRRPGLVEKPHTLPRNRQVPGFSI